MDFYKAIHILGLNKNFTEEELKSVYRKLSREYHPDKYEGTLQYEIMKRKQQEINAAREFLRKYLQTNPQIKMMSIKGYVELKQKELIRIIADDIPEKTNKNYQATLNAIKKLITNFEIELCNTSVIIKADVDKAYEECLKNIKIRFRNLKDFFYKQNDIIKEEVKETLIYDCTLKEFYEQLENVKRKYGRKTRVRKELEQEIKKYQHFEGYERLKIQIYVSLEKCLDEMEKRNFQNIEILIEKMNQEILNIFAKYNNQQQEIKKLSQEVYATKSETIQKSYEQLIISLKENLTFSEIETKIKQIKLLLEEHQNKLQKISTFNQNKELINNIYLNLIKKFSEEIKKHNIVTEKETILKLNEFFNRLLKIFTEGISKYKELTYFEQFNLLTFIDIDNDLKVVQKIIEQLNGETKKQEESKNKHSK